MDAQTTLQGCLLVFHPQQEVAKAIQRMFVERLPGLRVMVVARLSEMVHYASHEGPVFVWVDCESAHVLHQDLLLQMRGLCPQVHFLCFAVGTTSTLRRRLDLLEQDLICASAVDWERLAQVFASLGMMNRHPDYSDLKPSKLTKRQLQLLNLLEHGLSNARISEVLDISEHTVKVHFWRLFKRLGVENRLQALQKAKQLGLLVGSGAVAA